VNKRSSKARRSRSGPNDVHAVARPAQPAEFTLRVMARTAHEAARTWTLRRYVGRLAARAGPHDYRGQLRAVYRDLLKRWRYVMEPDEFVPGSARALLGHVLGTRYNRGPTCPDDLDCDVLETPWTQRGWGDCDDVATLVAACALALGMRPRWRIAQLPGTLHVAVEVETPTGERVDIDPVAYPRHGVQGEPAGFGWGASGPDVLVRLVELAEPGEGSGMGAVRRARRVRGPRRARNPRVRVDGGPRASHWVAVDPRDRGGPRVLAMPGSAAAVFRNGLVVDGAPAVDQYGSAYQYSANLDMWVPASQYGRIRRQRPGLVRLRRGFQRVVQGARRVVGKVLSNKWVARVVGGALQAFGIPLPLTIAMLRAVGGVMKSGGIIKLIRLARKNPREALRTLAKSVFDAGQGKLFEKFGLKFSGVDDLEAEPFHVTQPGGATFAAPVAMFLGLGEVQPDASLYQLADDVEDLDLPRETAESFSDNLVTTPTPTAGSYYKVQSGDTLLKIAGRAAGVGAGAARLAYAQAIAAHPTNAGTLRAPKNDFERDNFPLGLPSLAKRPVLFLPDLGAAQDTPGAPVPFPSGPGPLGPGPGGAPFPGPSQAPPAAPGGGGGGWLPLAAAAALAFAL
jgi:hypothetical protein